MFKGIHTRIQGMSQVEKERRKERKAHFLTECVTTSWNSLTQAVLGVTSLHELREL